MARSPDRLRDSIRHRLSLTPVGPAVETGVAGALYARDVARRGRNVLRWMGIRARHARRRIERLLTGHARSAAPLPRNAVTHISIDGTCLGREQTGYFNLLTELIRRLSQPNESPAAIHVIAAPSGRSALTTRIGTTAASRVRFHGPGWRAMHWSHVHAMAFGPQAQLIAMLLSLTLGALGIRTGSAIVGGAAAACLLGLTAVLLDEMAAGAAAAVGTPRHRLTARLIRFLWRRLPAPRGQAPARHTVEVLFWRGRFKWRTSRRIAIVQDMTTRIHPELHTSGNVEEFDEFLGYVQRHAHIIATVSDCSRRDIIERIAVCPDSVTVIPMPIHPHYHRPHFSRAVVNSYGFLALMSFASPLLSPARTFVA